MSSLLQELAHLCPHGGHRKYDAEPEPDHRAERQRVQLGIEEPADRQAKTDRDGRADPEGQ
jgi:hypothetical protein